TADVIWGHGYDATLGDKLSVTIIATGFASSPITGYEKAPEKKKSTLEEEPKSEIKSPLTSPTESNIWDNAREIQAPQEEPVLKVEEEVKEHKPDVQANTWSEVKKVPLEEPTAEEEQGTMNFDWDMENAKTKKTEEPSATQPTEEVKRYMLEDDLE